MIELTAKLSHPTRLLLRKDRPYNITLHVHKLKTHHSSFSHFWSSYFALLLLLTALSSLTSSSTPRSLNPTSTLRLCYHYLYGLVHIYSIVASSSYLQEHPLRLSRTTLLAFPLAYFSSCPPTHHSYIYYIHSFTSQNPTSSGFPVPVVRT